MLKKLWQLEIDNTIHLNTYNELVLLITTKGTLGNALNSIELTEENTDKLIFDLNNQELPVFIKNISLKSIIIDFNLQNEDMYYYLKNLFN